MCENWGQELEDKTPDFHPDQADLVRHRHSIHRSQDSPPFGAEEAKGSEIKSLAGSHQFPSAELALEL